MPSDSQHFFSSSASQRTSVTVLLWRALALLGIVLAIINMRIIRSRYGFGLADTNIPDMPVAKPSRRKDTARYKRRSKPRTTNAPPAKRGDHTALPASMQPPTISRTTTQQ